MRNVTVVLSILAVLVSATAPAHGESKREGLPERRGGGGTRWTASQTKASIPLRRKLNAMTFASRNRLPIALRLKTRFS